MLSFLCRKARAQQLCHILCLANPWAYLCRVLCTPPEFERSKHRRSLCHANARNACELSGRHCEDLREPNLPKTRDDAARNFEHILPRTPCAQEDGKQLRIAQGRSAVHDQALTWKFPRGKITQMHPHPP